LVSGRCHCCKAGTMAVRLLLAAQAARLFQHSPSVSRSQVMMTNCCRPSAEGAGWLRS
jgi:hypothetical protein